MTKKTQSGKVLVILLGIVIFVAAIATARYWMKNKPTAKRSSKVVKLIPSVKTIQISPIDHAVTIKTMGNVVPAKQINLVAQVKGEIIYTHKNFLPGGFVKKGETIVKIDPLDYKLAKLQKSSEVEKAQNDLSVEKGKQVVAKQEYSLLGTDLAVKDQELILRKPQLKLAKANLAAAKAKLEQAKVDLSRTKVHAPFNALIESKKIDTGSWVNIGSNIASLIATDHYWVDVNLPMDRLALLSIPEFNATKASPAIIKYPAAWGNKTRNAKVKRLKPSIDSKIRMAQLIIEVDDPLSQKEQNINQPRLLMGAFVEVDITAQTHKNVLPLPRNALRDGHQIWLSVENKLHIVDVYPIWKNQQFVYIPANQVTPDSHIIVSDLSAPVEGMLLTSQHHE